MYIEKISYTPEMVDGLRQSVMTYKVLLDQAKEETNSIEEAYELADRVYQNMLRSAQWYIVRSVCSGR